MAGQGSTASVHSNFSQRIFSTEKSNDFCAKNLIRILHGKFAGKNFFIVLSRFFANCISLLQIAFDFHQQLQVLTGIEFGIVLVVETPHED
jgi:hypothetical protein